jgi:hypothetical protein
MRKIRERQTTSKTRTVRALGSVGRRDQLPCSTAAQAPATAELLRLRHGTETRELDKTRPGFIALQRGEAAHATLCKA